MSLRSPLFSKKRGEAIPLVNYPQFCYNFLMKQQLSQKISLYLPLIIWCLVIFIFSNRKTTVNVGPNYWTDFVVKKIAHIIEYAILSILSYGAFNKSKIKALIFVLLYGISDEIHQSFVPGREPRIRDVIIDLLGGGLGLWMKKFIPPAMRQKLGL